jgi:hypothetical protein
MRSFDFLYSSRAWFCATSNTLSASQVAWLSFCVTLFSSDSWSRSIRATRGTVSASTEAESSWNLASITARASRCLPRTVSLVPS